MHDIEAALLGTSLGVRLADGRQEEHGHRNHMRAINAIYHVRRRRGRRWKAGACAAASCTNASKTDVPFVLAGSLRDDGPLPDTITDMNEAQDAYAEQLKGAGLVLCLGSMLHSIATGNMLPSWVKIVCVDINPAVATKVSDRGTGQAVGVVTDVGLFLDLLSQDADQQMKRTVHRRTRQAGVDAAPAGDRDLAESVSAVTKSKSIPEFTSVCPKTGLARSRRAHTALRARQALPGVEVAEDVHAGLSQPRDLP